MLNCPAGYCKLSWKKRTNGNSVKIFSVTGTAPSRTNTWTRLIAWPLFMFRKDTTALRRRDLCDKIKGQRGALASQDVQGSTVVRFR